MAFVPTPYGVRVELVYSWETQIVENVLNYRGEEVPDATELRQIGLEAITKWLATIKDMQSIFVSLISVKVTSLETQFSPGVEVTTGLPVTGSVNSVSVPNNVAVCVSLSTPLRGRSYRGRIYHPGLPTTMVSGSTLTTGVVAAMIDAYTDWLTINTLNREYTLCVLSKTQNGTPRAQGVLTEVTSLLVDPTVDSQRRRLPGRGT